MYKLNRDNHQYNVNASKVNIGADLSNRIFSLGKLVVLVFKYVLITKSEY